MNKGHHWLAAVLTALIFSGNAWGLIPNNNAQRNASDIAQTLGHEITHARLRQGATRDRGQYNEEYAELMGNYAADSLQFSAKTYTNIDLDPDITTNTQTYTQNDRALLERNTNDWYQNLTRTRQSGGAVDQRLTPQQENDKTAALAQCQNALCRQATDLKYSAISTAQGAAEITGAVYGAAEQLATDIASLATLLGELIDDPQKAAAAAEQLDSAINRLNAILDGDNITDAEKARAARLLNETVQRTKAAAQDAAELDGPGLSASFGEGQKEGAMVAAALGITKLNRVLKELKTNNSAKALPSLQVPNAGGKIVSDVTKQDEVFFRVFSGDSTKGSFLIKVPPTSQKGAVEALALPPGNNADFIQQVLVPAGTRLQRSRALPAFGHRGGKEQFQLLDKIPNKNFGSGVPFK